MAGGRNGSLIPARERLSRALRWLDAQERDDHAVVAEACRRFDLSPADEELLQRMWRKRREASIPPDHRRP